LNLYNSGCIFKRAAVNYYEEIRSNIQQWAKENIINNLKDLLIVWFALDSIKNVWYDNYLNCWQDLIESVEEYSNRFKWLFKKMDPNNGILVTNIIWQFLSRLNSTITLLVYTRISADLQIAINVAKSIKVRYKIF